jgi:hypothetical protein
MAMLNGTVKSQPPLVDRGPAADAMASPRWREVKAAAGYVRESTEEQGQGFSPGDAAQGHRAVGR